MDHLLSVRFWGAVVALVAAATLAVVVYASTDVADRIAGAGTLPARRVETSGVIVDFAVGSGWRVRDGRTIGGVDVFLDDGRRFVVGEGTSVDLGCTPTVDPGTCAFLADLLADAVVWFALVPAPPDGRLDLPGAVAVLDAGREARLANGWIVPLVDRVERVCPAVETSSFRDFVNRIGADGVAVYDLGVGEVTTVRCVVD
jgi:hypothetical protein